MGARYSCDFCGAIFDHRGCITRARLLVSVGGYRGDEWERQGGSTESVAATWLFCADCQGRAFDALWKAACPHREKGASAAEAAAAPAVVAEPASFKVVPGKRHRMRDNQITDDAVKGPHAWPGDCQYSAHVAGRVETWTSDGFIYPNKKPHSRDLVAVVEDDAEG